MVFDIKTLINLKGYRVRMQVNTEEYEGIITNVITETLCVGLGNARSLTDGGYYHILFFFAYEIDSCVVVDKPEDLKNIKPNNSTEEDGPRLVKLRPLPFHQRGGKPQDNVDTDNLLIGGVEDNEKEYIQDDLSDDDDDDGDILPSEKFMYPIPDENIIIDMINDDFQQTIFSIMKEQSIGISLEGGSIGRHGNICWILVSTEKHVYLFDLCALGKKAFDNGLKDVLQNPSILKILHDCRAPSDALFHQFGVRLINIFDTQSSDAVVQWKLHNRMPRFVRNLSNCLSDYLKIDVKIPDFTKAHHQWQPGKDLSVWTHRPLPKRLMKSAARRVMFLKELRFAVLGRYIADLNSGAEIYLSVVRDASEQELDLSQSSPHVLPDAFQKLQVKDKKYFHNHSSYQANVDNARCYKTLMHSRNPYNAPNRDLWFKKDRDQMKEPIVMKTSDQVLQKNFDEQCNVTKLSGTPNEKSDANTEVHKISSSSNYFSNSKNSGAQIKYESQSCSASAEPKKQHWDDSLRFENQLYPKSCPKKRIDWPKVVSQRTSSTTNIAMIPAGMTPSLGKGTKIRQSS